MGDKDTWKNWINTNTGTEHRSNLKSSKSNISKVREVYEIEIWGLILKNL